MYKKQCAFNHLDPICNRIISEEFDNERVSLITREQPSLIFPKIAQRRFHLNRNSR